MGFNKLIPEMPFHSKEEVGSINRQLKIWRIAGSKENEFTYTMVFTLLMRLEKHSKGANNKIPIDNSFN